MGHGTSAVHLGSISEKGMKIGGKDVPKRNGAVYGAGVYVSPFVEVASQYAPTIKIKGKKYQIVFQCRVKPGSYHAHLPYGNSSEDKTKHGKKSYWVVEDGKNVRPYGICIKEY